MTRICEECKKSYDDFKSTADAWDSFCSDLCQKRGWRAVNLLDIIIELLGKKK